MKLVQKLNDPNIANELVNLLEDNGVPAILNSNGLENRGTHIPDGHEIWIYINNQYSEARKLIADNAYQVKNPVDITEFYKEIESNEANKQLNEIKNSFIKYGAILIMISIVLTVVFFKLKT